jgi:hypothetical protein
VRWWLEFYSEGRQILAHCRVEAPTPATALVLGRRSVLDEYPPVRTWRAGSQFEQAPSLASSGSDGWVLYRIQKDE